jgi:hypothetical protein
MYSVHVCTTNDRELPPPELGRGLTWDRLTEILLREVSADASNLFAEPIRDEARDQTHWHITARDDPKPVSALSADERDKLQIRLNDRRQEISRFADRVEAEGGDANLRLAAALRSVLTVPDERQHVWSADGKPVLTAWGRRPANLSAPPPRFIKRPPTSQQAPIVGPDSSAAAIHGMSNIAYEREDRVAKAPPIHGKSNIAYERSGEPDAGRPSAVQTAPTIGLSPPPPLPAPPRRIWASALLWALFVLLVGGSYYALLPACGLGVPIFGQASNRCDIGKSAELLAQEERNSVLRDAISKAELEIAQKHSRCASPHHAQNDDGPGRQQRDAEVQPRTNDVTRPTVKDAEDRRKQANVVSRGKLDITLVWNGKEDLDLHVYCPGGHIFFSGRTACGGTLDVDRNSGIASAVENPLEHITFEGDPPPGDYRIDVTLFDRFSLPERTIPFTVVMHDADGDHAYKSEVQKWREPVTVATFKR